MLWGPELVRERKGIWADAEQALGTEVVPCGSLREEQWRAGRAAGGENTVNVRKFSCGREYGNRQKVFTADCVADRLKAAGRAAETS